MLEILERITAGQGDLEDLEKLKRLAQLDAQDVALRPGPGGPQPGAEHAGAFPRRVPGPRRRASAARPSKCTALIHYEIDPRSASAARSAPATARWSASAARASEPHVIDQLRCIKCGRCFEVCRSTPVEA